MRTLKQLNEERLVSRILFTAYQYLKIKHKWLSLFLLSETKEIHGIELKIHTVTGHPSTEIKSWIQLGEVIDTSAPKKPSIVSLTLTFPASHDTETGFTKQRKLLLATTHDQVSDQLWLWPPLSNPVRTCADLNFVKKKRKTLVTDRDHFTDFRDYPRLDFVFKLL